MSNQSIDRHGEIVMASAFSKRLSTFKQHPILISSHNTSTLLKNIGKVNPSVKTGELVGKTEWFVGEGNPEADWGFKLAEKGMAAFSVGFIPHAMVSRGDEGFESLTKEMKISKKDLEDLHTIYTDVELLELSQVLIPANQNALQKSLESTDEIEKEMAVNIKAYMDENPDDFTDLPDNSLDIKSIEDTISHLEEIKLSLQPLTKTEKNSVNEMAALLMTKDVDTKEYNVLVRHYREFDREVPELKEYVSIRDILTGVKDVDTQELMIDDLTKEKEALIVIDDQTKELSKNNEAIKQMLESINGVKEKLFETTKEVEKDNSQDAMQLILNKVKEAKEDLSGSREANT
jgi:hypothetical protein